MIKTYFKSVAQSIDNFCLPPSKAEESAVRTWQTVGLSSSPMRYTAFFLSVVPITISALGILRHPIVGFGKAIPEVAKGHYRVASTEWLKGLKQSVRSMAQVALLASTAFWGLFSRRFYAVLIEPENVTNQKKYNQLLTEKTDTEALLKKATTTQKETSDLKQTIETLKNTNESIGKERIGFKKLSEDFMKQNEELMVSNFELNKSHTELKKQLDENESAKEIDRLQEDIKFWKEAHTKLKTELETFQKEVNPSITKIETIQKEFEDAKEKLEEAKEKLTNAQSDNTSLSLQITTLLENISNLKNQSETSSNIDKEVIKTIKDSHESIKNLYETALSEIGSLTHINNSLKDQVHSLEISTSELEEEVANLNKKNEGYLNGLFELEKSRFSDKDDDNITKNNDNAPQTPPKNKVSQDRKFNSVKINTKNRGLRKSISKDLLERMRTFDPNVTTSEETDSVPVKNINNDDFK